MSLNYYLLFMDFFKTSLGKTIAILVGVFLVVASVGAGMDAYKSYREGKEQFKNTITISAEGKVTAVPDIALVSLSVVSQGNTVATVTTENNRKMNAIIEAVKGMGVEARDIKTTSYYLTPQYDNQVIILDRVVPSQPPKIIGYSLEQSLEVKVRQIDKAGDIVQKGTDLGANQIGQLTFTIDDPEDLKSEARAEALQKATEKARVLAQQAGVQLGKVTNFSEDNFYFPPFYARDMAMGAASVAEKAPAPTLEPGSQDVTVNVSVTFEIY